MAKMETIRNKDKAFDLFHMTDWGDGNAKEKKTENKSYKKIVTYKNARQSRITMISKIKLVCGLRAVRSLMFVRMTLKKIELAKELFVLEMEQG